MKSVTAKPFWPILMILLSNCCQRWEVIVSQTRRDCEVLRYSPFVIHVVRLPQRTHIDDGRYRIDGCAGEIPEQKIRHAAPGVNSIEAIKTARVTRLFLGIVALVELEAELQ